MLGDFMKKIVLGTLALSAVLFCGCDNNPWTRARYNSKIFSSVNNLMQIGSALEMYTLGSKGQLRPHGMTAEGDLSQDPGLVFELLRRQGHLTDATVYAAPYGLTEVAEAGEELRGKNCGYVYIYVGPQYASASVVAFEKPWHLPKYADRLTVLYADGYVKTHKIENVSEMSCRDLILNYPEIFGLNYNAGDPLPTDKFDEERE